MKLILVVAIVVVAVAVVAMVVGPLLAGRKHPRPADQPPEMRRNRPSSTSDDSGLVE